MCVHTYVRMYVCPYVRMHAFMYVSMYVSWDISATMWYGLVFIFSSSDKTIHHPTMGSPADIGSTHSETWESMDWIRELAAGETSVKDVGKMLRTCLEKNVRFSASLVCTDILWDCWSARNAVKWECSTLAGHTIQENNHGWRNSNLPDKKWLC